MALCKNVSARGRLGRSAAPNVYFGTRSISPKLIKLPVDIWYAGGCVQALQLVKLG